MQGKIFLKETFRLEEKLCNTPDVLERENLKKSQSSQQKEYDSKIATVKQIVKRKNCPMFNSVTE